MGDGRVAGEVRGTTTTTSNSHFRVQFRTLRGEKFERPRYRCEDIKRTELKWIQLRVSTAFIWHRVGACGVLFCGSSKAILKFFWGSSEALLRLFEALPKLFWCSFEALLRLFRSSFEAPLKVFWDSFEALSSLLRSSFQSLLKLFWGSFDAF